MDNSINQFPLTLNNKIKPFVIATVIILINYTFISKDNVINPATRHLQAKRIDYFFQNISNNVYVGKWNSTDTPINFENNHGITNFMLVRKNIINTLDSLDGLYLKIQIKDDEYNDRWYSIRGRTVLNDTYVKFDNNLLILKLNTSIIEGILFDIYNEINGIIH